MLYRRSTLFALPAAAALLGAGFIAPAAAQTIVTTVPAYQQVQSTIVVAPTAPPAPEAETIPPPPNGETTTYTWNPGHWNWNGASWVWVAGSYMQRTTAPAPTAVWVPGQWQQQPSGGYVWVAGHWQV